jgi:uncharacterized protein YndB with AHSA1/START domain
MSEVQQQALVDAPVSTVWELVGDPSCYPEWLPRVLEIQGERFEEGGSSSCRCLANRWSAATRPTS